MYIIICETDHQSRFDAWDTVLRTGALGWPRRMGWGGSWEEGSGWGTHVHPWLIHVNVWQKPLQYCKVISLQLKINKLNKKYKIIGTTANRESDWSTIAFYNMPFICFLIIFLFLYFSCVPHPEPSSLLPPHTIPLGHPSAPAPSILYPASNLDWQFISYMTLYMFQCHSPKSSPAPSPTESKRLFYRSVSLLLSHIQGYRYHLSKFHIHALVYCIGVFLSGLLDFV